MSDYVLQVYEEDDTTLYFEVGTAAAHANPYLQTPETGAESEIDPQECSARIGRYTVRVIDPQTGATQVERFLTGLLGNSVGYSEINGRRAVLKHATGEIITDGICAGSKLLQSFAGFELALDDIRARAIEVPVFSRADTSTVFPRGVQSGYGLLPNGEWLIAPTVPVEGTFIRGDDGTDGIFHIEGNRDVHIQQGWFLTDAMREVAKPEWDATAEANVIRNVEIWWRTLGGSWNVLSDMPVRGFMTEGVWTEPRFWNSYFEVEAESGATVLAGMNLSATSSVAVPADGATVEVMVVYSGPPTEEYPFHFEGTAGTFLRNAIRGDYSTDKDGTALDPGLRYDEDAFTGADTPLALQTPVRVRITEPADDLREWIEDAFRELGAIPALNASGEISPIGQQLPDELVTLPEINDSNAQPIAAWEHPISSAITQLDGSYPRDYRMPATEDPRGDRSAGDGIATVDQKVTVRPNDLTIQNVMGVQSFELKGFLFRALGGSEGEPITGDVMDETGSQIFYRRGHELIDRFAFGGQSDFVKVMRSDADMAALRVGDWCLDARSWSPNYSTGERGRNHLVQVVSIRDVNPAWREMRIVDAAPYANPVGQPTLGTVTVDAQGVVSVPVDAIAAGSEARVDYAVSSTEPATSSPLWTYLGRTATVGTLTSPPLPAASTIWIRSRGEKEGRRPSAWTNAVSVSVGNIPRIASAAVTIDGETATVTWTPNAAAAGVRIYYAAHDPTQTPALTDYIDVDADDGEVELPITVAAGQRVSVELEPYTGWDGTDVTGTAGARVRRSAVREITDVNRNLLVTYEVTGKTDTQITLKFYGGAEVDDIWIFNQLIELPQVGSRIPTDIADRDAILDPGDEYVVDIPPQGHMRVLHAIGYSATSENGEIEEIEIGPALRSSPYFEYVSPRPGSTALTTDIELRIIDPQGLAGTLKVWTNAAGVGDADPTSTEDDSYAVVSTPATIGPAQFAGLDEIVVHPGRGKLIYLEYINSNGDSSGQRSEFLHGWGTLVGLDDELREASVTRTKILDGAVNDLKLAALAVTNAKLALASVDTANVVDGAMTALKIGLAAITTTKIADDAISTPKLQALSVDAGKLAAGAVIAGKISAGAIDATSLIAAGIITNTLIATGTITGDRLVANTITAAQIAALTITANQISANAITASKILAGEVNSLHIASISLAVMQAVVVNLAALTADLGSVTTGLIGGANGQIRFGSSSYAISAGKWIDFLPAASGGTGVFIKHDKLSLNEDGSASYAGKLTAQDVDISEGGRIVLRPAGLYGMGYLSWFNGSSTEVASIGADSAGDMSLSTFGSSTADIKFWPNNTLVAEFRASARATDESALFLDISGTGFVRVKREAGTGYLYV